MSEKRGWRLSRLGEWLGRRSGPGGLMMAGPWGGDTGDGSGDEPGRKNPWAKPTVGQPTGPRSTVDNASDKLREMFGVTQGTGGGGSSGGSGGPGRFARGVDKSVWLWGVLGLMILWLASTTWWRIGPQESGVVQTFGSYSRTMGPGVHFTLPAPIQTVTKVNSEVREIAIGSTAATDQKLVLTSDQNIIDLAYNVRWRVSSPEAYLFRFADQERVVRETAESAMRSVVANFSLDDTLGPGRGAIASEVAERTQQILDSYSAGIRIEGVEIKQADPPAQVNDAFKAVTQAQQNAARDQNDARAYSQQVTALAQGEAESFDKVYEQYRQAPEVTRRRMYYETMEQVLKSVDKTIVEVPGVVPYLQTQTGRQSAPPPPPPVPAPAASPGASQ